MDINIERRKDKSIEELVYSERAREKEEKKRKRERKPERVREGGSYLPWVPL